MSKKKDREKYLPDHKEDTKVFKNTIEVVSKDAVANKLSILETILIGVSLITILLFILYTFNDPMFQLISMIGLGVLIVIKIVLHFFNKHIYHHFWPIFGLLILCLGIYGLGLFLLYLNKESTFFTETTSLAIFFGFILLLFIQLLFLSPSTHSFKGKIITKHFWLASMFAQFAFGLAILPLISNEAFSYFDKLTIKTPWEIVFIICLVILLGWFVAPNKKKKSK